MYSISTTGYSNNQEIVDKDNKKRKGFKTRKRRKLPKKCNLPFKKM